LGHIWAIFSKTDLVILEGKKEGENTCKMNAPFSRNTSDPFVIPGGSSEAFFTRVGEPSQDEFGLGSELKDLSGVVRIAKNGRPRFLSSRKDRIPLTIGSLTMHPICELVCPNLTQFRTLLPLHQAQPELPPAPA
jgi:hypothetical protein